jgi:hypothetical protein
VKNTKTACRIYKNVYGIFKKWAIYRRQKMTEDKEVVYMILNGEGHKLEINKQDDCFSYNLYRLPMDKEAVLVLTGNGFNTYEALIDDLSEVSTGLRDIFG